MRPAVRHGQARGGATRLDFFPAKGIALERTKTRAADGRHEASLQLLFAHDPEGKLPGLKGVVAVERAGAWKYHDLQITAQRTRH